MQPGRVSGKNCADKKAAIKKERGKRSQLVIVPVEA
jgi:hypothetical protein